MAIVGGYYMAIYEKNFTPYYTNGWEDQPSENTPIMAEALDTYDATFQKIEDFLANLDLSGLGGDYALLSEAGHSISGSVAEDTGFLTLNLLNKAGQALSTKTFYLPFGQLFKYATFENGVIKFKYFSDAEYNMDISSLIDGLVPTTRKIADIDMADDITAEELVEATRAVSGEVYVDFAEAEQTNPTLFEFMPYPIGADGKKSVGQSGQIYVSNGDGTFSWITLGVAEGGAY